MPIPNPFARLSLSLAAVAIAIAIAVAAGAAQAATAAAPDASDHYFLMKQVTTPTSTRTARSTAIGTLYRWCDRSPEGNRSAPADTRV